MVSNPKLPINWTYLATIRLIMCSLGPYLRDFCAAGDLFDDPLLDNRSWGLHVPFIEIKDIIWKIETKTLLALLLAS